MPKNDFESTNFENFEKVVHKFGRSDDDMILWKNAYFHYMQTWFDAQLDQKILDGIYSVRSYKGQFNLANGDQFRTFLLEI